MKKNPWILAVLLSFAWSGPAAMDLGAAERPAKTEKTVFGAGCFWCVELIFEHTSGVLGVVSGYAGGTVKNPTYQQVGAGETGHAEVIEIEYDPARISYGQLLKIFWDSHDPTVKNGVAPDFGTQYRSIILYQNDAEKKAAEKSKAELQKKLGKTIHTEIVPLGVFYPAEEYHQDFAKKNPTHSYIQNVSQPRKKETEARAGVP